MCLPTICYCHFTRVSARETVITAVFIAEMTDRNIDFQYSI